jgi:hypothetical protein
MRRSVARTIDGMIDASAMYARPYTAGLSRSLDRHAHPDRVEHGVSGPASSVGSFTPPQAATAAVPSVALLLRTTVTRPEMRPVDSPSIHVGALPEITPVDPSESGE